MVTRNPPRKKRAGLKKKPLWLWLLIGIPVCIILVCGYLLYQNYNISPGEQDRSAMSPPSGTGITEFPDLPEPKESEAGTKLAVEEYKLFFGNEDFNSRIADCEDLFPVYRYGKGVEDIINNSLTELLKGPSQTEQEQGYYTSLNSGVRLLGIRMESGTVFADFSWELEEDVAGSCQTLAIRAQINETLLQFEGVVKVVILVEGNPESVLQP